ncbi:MAG: hypothetical protein JWP91_2504 [Fibrobacteres bacterium]|nr:hypothetical protein [Fibrobacterota bacterium]
MNKDIPAWLAVWDAIGARSKAFLNGIEIDLTKEDFSEILLLLKHSIDSCIASQSLLIAESRFEGLVPLSRKIFETWVQLKYLVRYPIGLRHYALFERLKTAENHRYLLQANMELVESGEEPILSESEEARVLSQIKKEERMVAYFASLGVARRKVKNKNGKETQAKAWFENYKGVPHLGALAEIVREKRMYVTFYPGWSGSQHGQTVSIDYALRAEDGRFETKTSDELRNECWSLFTLSVMIGAAAHLTLVMRSDPAAYDRESDALLEISRPLGMGKEFQAHFEKVKAYFTP